MKNYIFMLATVFALVFSGCGGGGSSTADSGTPPVASSNTVSGYVEDDPIPNATVVLKDSSGNTVESTTTDSNGFYTFDAVLKTDETYTIETSGVLSDQNISMSSIVVFDGEDIVGNVNPLTHLKYKLTNDNNYTIEDAESAVRKYFKILDGKSLESVRFDKGSEAYIGLLSIANSFNDEGSLPIDALDGVLADMLSGDNALKSRVAKKNTLEVNKDTLEVGETANLTLSGLTLTDKHKVVWIGADKSESTISNSVTLYGAGEKEIVAKVLYNDELIDELRQTLRFVETKAAEEIAISASEDTNVSTANMSVSILAESTTVDKISLTEIDHGTSSDVFKEFKLEPSGTTFSKPIEIRIPYDLSTIDDPSTLVITRTEEDGTVTILKTEVDYRTQELVVKTDHFSKFKLVKAETSKKEIRDYIEGDIEDNFFFKRVAYKEPLGISKKGFPDLLIYMKQDGYSPLNDEMKEYAKTFYDDGFKYVNNYDRYYEEAMKYVLAEKVSGDSDMTKFELLVDSYKKFRLALYLDEYSSQGMLEDPYDYGGIWSNKATRLDFFNEVQRIETDDTFILNGENAYSINGMQALKYAITANTVNDISKYILEKAYTSAGSKILVSQIVNYAIKETKHALKLHAEYDTSIAYFQCMKIEKGWNLLTFKIGDEKVFSVDGINNTIEIHSKGLNLLDTLTFDHEAAYGMSSNDDLNAFAGCIYNKQKKLSEYYSDHNISSKRYSENIPLIKKLVADLKDKKIEKYITLLKLLSFSDMEMREYSRHLKVVATANTALIIRDIMIERELIKNGIKAFKTSSLLNDPVARKSANIRFREYYVKHSSRTISRSTSSDSVESLDVVDPSDFLSLGLSISDAHFADIKIDRMNLVTNTLTLDRKASEGVSASYYEATSDAYVENRYSRTDFEADDFTFDDESKRYKLNFKTIFSGLSISEPSLFEAILTLQVTYKGKPYTLSKEYSFIADSDDSVTIKPVERGSFDFTVHSDSGDLLKEAEVSVGSRSCTTDTLGKCTIDNLVPAEYTAAITKDGYLPTYMDTFIDKAGTKELSFTLKKVDLVEGEMYLDAVAVRSEVSPLSFTFYIAAVGEDLELSIDYGDDTNSSGPLSSLVSKDGSIKHTYSSAGAYDVVVTITSKDEATKSKELKVYPISDDSSVDVVFLVDLSGSYGSSLNNFKSKAKEIAQAFSTLGSDIRVGLTSFVDFPEYGSSTDYAFKLDHNLTYNIDDFDNSLQSMSLFYGGDTSESQIEALYQTAQQMNWSDSSKKYIFIATDASFHNRDTESSYPGKGYKETLALLKSKNIVVMGLNRNTDIDDVTKVTEDTGGEVFMLDSSSSDIAEKILNFTLEKSIESRNIIRTKQHEVGSILQGNTN